MLKAGVSFLTGIISFSLLGSAHASSRDPDKTPYHKAKPIGGDGFGYVDKHLRDGSLLAAGVIFGRHASLVEARRIAFYRASEVTEAAGKKYIIVNKVQPTWIFGRYATSLEYVVNFNPSDEPGDSDSCGYDSAGATCHTIVARKIMDEIGPQLTFETRK